MTAAIVVFSALTALVYLPNIVEVFGIHNDYELLMVKSLSFLHPEAEQQFRIARPVAALLSNVPVWPLGGLEDYRWSRLFSIVTVCGLGALMMFLCVRRMRVKVFPAFGLTLGTFMVLPFIYSVLNTAAWAPHLISVLVAFAAYARLSNSNVRLLAFLNVSRSDDRWMVFRQALAYAKSKAVLAACLIYQISFYDYPPNALVLTLFPIVIVLFSTAPAAYRRLLAARDIGFIAVNEVLYSFSTKLLYMPLVDIILGPQAKPDPILNPFAARIAPSYQFSINADPIEFLTRLWRVLRVSGDLWFLPQLHVHVFAGLVFLLAIVVANFIGGRNLGVLGAEFASSSGLMRLRIRNVSPEGVIVLAVVAISFLISVSPVVAAGGGFVTYRTIAIPSAIAAIAFIFAVSGLTQFLWAALGGVPGGAIRAGQAAMVASVIAATASNFWANYQTMTLARNEFAYFTGIVKAALNNNSRAIVLYDKRPFSLPEDHPVVYDAKGVAVPPYELACLSGYCVQTGAIAHIAAERLGYPLNHFTVFPMRPGDPFTNMDCSALIASLSAPLPDDAPVRIVSILRWLKSLRPLTCVNYNLSWHDLEWKPPDVPRR